MKIEQFQQLVAAKGRELYRPMPWRDDVRPYYVLVSELMLQQTQVDRVKPKFLAFIERFPSQADLAAASLSEVLQLWQGLGYNRRAKFLHQAAQMVERDLAGEFPGDVAGLIKLPGVGKNTAGAIMAYAFNQPVVFVETNVRTVYFHHFFSPLDVVTDGQIMELLEKTMDRQHTRQFYWALMDYGSWLKRQGVKNVGQSQHYRKQSALKGSVREVRGQIIKALTTSPLLPLELEQLLEVDERFDVALTGLVRDGLVEYDQGRLQLSN